MDSILWMETFQMIQTCWFLTNAALTVLLIQRSWFKWNSCHNFEHVTHFWQCASDNFLVSFSDFCSSVILLLTDLSSLVQIWLEDWEDTRILIEQDKMFLQNQPRSVWMIPNALFKCIHHCFSVFWPGCHDTQRLLYFVTHSFCGSAQSPTTPIVLVPFPCAAPPLQCVAMVSHTVLLP